jgi:hypothetical protein
MVSKTRASNVWRYALYLWAAFLIILCYALFTYPRVWWQDVVHGWSVALVPPLVVTLALHTVRLYRHGFQSLLVFAAVIELACLVQVGWAVRPYVWYSAQSATRATHVATERFLLFDAASGPINLTAIHQVIESERPVLVVVLAAQNTDAVMSVWNRYPYHLSSDVSYGGRVDIHSMFPFGEPTLRNLGIDAYPGCVSVVRVSPEVELEVAGFDLQVPRARLDFERSRVSARRVASIFRYSDYPRMVFGGFRMPPTAPPTTMYVEQLKLKSVLFTQGLFGLWEVTHRLFDFASNINVFTAKSIKVTDVTEWTTARDGFRGLAFTAAMPASPKESDGRREFLQGER